MHGTADGKLKKGGIMFDDLDFMKDDVDGDGTHSHKEDSII